VMVFQKSLDKFMVKLIEDIISHGFSSVLKWNFCIKIEIVHIKCTMWWIHVVLSMFQ
jgi:hypothetical protein